MNSCAIDFRILSYIYSGLNVRLVFEVGFSICFFRSFLLVFVDGEFDGLRSNLTLVR